MINICIQTDDFDIGHVYSSFQKKCPAAGAIVQFTGLVRGDVVHASSVQSLSIEHYPGMTESAIKNIVEQAMQRWQLQGATVIHRVGELLAGEQIVLVIVAAEHRKAAFEAAMFIMDMLKSDVPLWKKQTTAAGQAWVAQKQSDKMQKLRWD